MSLYKSARACECGYETLRRQNWCQHRKTCKSLKKHADETESLRNENDWLKHQISEKDKQISELLVAVREDRKRPRTVNNTTNNNINIVYPFKKERFDEVSSDDFRQLIADPPTAVANLIRLAHKDPRNVNVRVPNRREATRYEIATEVDGEMKWVASDKDLVLDDIYLTYSTKLEAHADEDDGGVGARFCRHSDAVKGSQDGDDNGRLYEAEKARIHMVLTTRE
jgi:hypothetical protein